MNIITLSGTLKRPAVKVSKDDGKMTIALFTLEVARDGNGQDFIDCKAFGKKADAILAANEGAAIELSGELRSESWGPQGARKFGMKVKTDAVVIDGAQVGEAAGEDAGEPEADEDAA